MGPGFKKGQMMKSFSSVNIQPLMCKLMNLESSQSEGTWQIFEPYLNLATSDANIIKISNFALPLFTYLLYHLTLNFN